MHNYTVDANGTYDVTVAMSYDNAERWLGYFQANSSAANHITNTTVEPGVVSLSNIQYHPTVIVTLLVHKVHNRE